MSFIDYNEFIEKNDTVILYLNTNNMYSIKVIENLTNKHGELVENVLQTIYGALKVSTLIGHKYGTKVELSRGWAYVLKPTAELWTLTLPHRTQIIYTPDISLIVYQLDIKPGSFVIESGTGSGSLTHALARRIAPNGHVFSFDFHEQRVNLAKDEFIAHRIDNLVTVKLMDVCNDGFGTELNGKADAVFLDLPHPWLVCKFAVQAIKFEGGRFCSFSPCIEQVQKTSAILNQFGFTEITTIECLQREINVNKRTLPVLTLNKKSQEVGNEEKPNQENKYNFIGSSYGTCTAGHTGYLTFATLPPLRARSTFTT